MYIVKFKKWMCILEIAHYSNNNRIAIELTDIKTGEPVAVASVNLTVLELEPDEVAIKSYSENEGMYEALLEAGIISKFIREEYTGFVKVQICKLLIE